MNNKIKVFENAEFGSVRAMTINDEPWFVGKDVAMILGYTNPYAAVKRHCRAPLTKRYGVYGKTQYRAP